MRRFLLTGAGFSKNWGGYLAREVWERVLTHPSIRAENRLRTVLLESVPNYETALACVRQDSPALAALFEHALVDVYQEQDISQYGSQVGEARSFNGEKFNAFVDAFRASDGTGVIFSLNQDVLLERRYRRPLYAPGVGDVRFRSGSDPLANEHLRSVDVTSAPPIVTGAMNYLKLHGSFNWRSSDGNSIVISGGDKLEQMTSRFPLLGSYYNQFKAWICDPQALIVVCGYSFCDLHINTVLADAADAGASVAIFDTASPEQLLGQCKADDPLQRKRIWNRVVAYCSTPLASLFGALSGHERLIQRSLQLNAGDER